MSIGTHKDRGTALELFSRPQRAGLLGAARRARSVMTCGPRAAGSAGGHKGEGACSRDVRRPRSVGSARRLSVAAHRWPLSLSPSRAPKPERRSSPTAFVSFGLRPDPSAHAPGPAETLRPLTWEGILSAAPQPTTKYAWELRTRGTEQRRERQMPSTLARFASPRAGIRTCACAHVRAKSHERSMSKVRGLPIKAIVFTWVVELMALNAAYFP